MSAPESPARLRACAREGRKRLLTAAGPRVATALAACDVRAVLAGEALVTGGLALAVGQALGNREAPVFALLDDKMVEAGATWEAARVAVQHGCEGLTAVLLHTPGWERAGAGFRAFGWHVIDVDGHDVPALLGALAEAQRAAGKPVLVVARVARGMGVSFMGDWPDERVPTAAEITAGLAELGGPASAGEVWAAIGGEPACRLADGTEVGNSPASLPALAVGFMAARP